MPRYEADGLLESPQAAYGSEYSADYGGREAPIEPVSEQGIVGHYEFEAARDRNPLLRRVTRRRPQDNSLEAILERTKLLNDVCAPSHIGNGIYISNFETAAAYCHQTTHPHFPKIKYVLSLICFAEAKKELYEELKPRQPRQFVEHKTVRIRDSVRTNILEWFPELCAFIEKAVRQRHDPNFDGSKPTDGILIHCRKGMSRSATVVIAYLMWKNGWNALDAFECVQDARPVAWPNVGFYDQLIQWSALEYNFINKETNKPYSEFLEFCTSHQLHTSEDGPGDL